VHCLQHSVLGVAILAFAIFTQTVPGQAKISYHKQIAPLLRANCTGCHHPGKLKGELDLSSYAGFAKGGDNGPVFMPGKPKDSMVLEMITGPDPDMPDDGDPLSAEEVALFSRWITEGAKDDSPAPVDSGTKAPTAYGAPPPTAAIAFSPDGSVLAVAGYHEVLLHSVAVGGITTRLVGKSPKIQSLTFSADGKWLAVAGGSPSRFGEIQIWDVAKKKLHRSFAVTADTLFGISLSGDSKLVAVGCADRTVRMLRMEDGKELLRFRSHAGWVLGTCFTLDNKQLISGGRDMALKIIDLSNGRFVDDINSPLDPILGLARHPKKNEVVYAGGLGIARHYRISDNQKRTAARRDTNLIRAFERQSGAVHAVAFSADGARIVVGGADPVARVHDVKTGKVVARLSGHTGPLFAVAFQPDGKRVVTSGFDGMLRFYDPKTGKLLQTTPAVPVRTSASPFPEFITSLTIRPSTLSLRDGRDARSVLVSGITAQGKHIDLTSLSRLFAVSDTLAVDAEGYVSGKKKGKAVVRISAAGLTTELPVEVVNADLPAIHFGRDVMPILGRAGCNAGTCHGAQAGQNGFVLSLRGFDLERDYRSLVHDLSGRRFDRVHPAESLMLQKSTAGVPHEGKQVIKPGSRHYDILHKWIVEGTKFSNDDKNRVTDLTVIPERVDLAMPGEHQSVLVIARYADGTTSDVTRDAIISVSNMEVAKIDKTIVTSKRRGEASVLVRYEGRYATAPITVMGNRNGFAWKASPRQNFIDDHVDRKLARVKVLASGLCTDSEFVRRLHLDLTGKPPTPAAAQKFVMDKGDSRKKREALIDELIGSPDYVEHWANKWADLLQCNSRTLGEKGVWVFRNWISRAVAENKPYDKFVHELVTASGSTYDEPAANYMRALSNKGRKPDTTKMTEDITQTFLGVRFGCCKCHNHPFERWTQDQYYEITAQFARVRYKKGADAGELVIFDSYNGGETVHPRTSGMVAPGVPYDSDGPGDDGSATRREKFASWLTTKNNRLFARSYVNRVWSYLFGVGIIEPVDDIRAGNPPSNPELLDALEKEFIASKFDFNKLVRTICRSHTWQRSFRTHKWNTGDRINFAHAVPRRLSAEQLLDAVAIATGVPTKIAGLPEGSRSVEAPDGIVKGNDFLKLFGRPKRESACECARSSNLSLAHALNLVGGKTLHNAIIDAQGRVAKLIASGADDRAVVAQLYWAAFSRAPTAKELSNFATLGKAEERLASAQDLLWALTNSPAFLFNR
jgi:WD40 repeat protein